MSVNIQFTYSVKSEFNLKNTVYMRTKRSLILIIAMQNMNDENVFSIHYSNFIQGMEFRIRVSKYEVLKVILNNANC